MVGAVTEHTGQPEQWRRYLALLIDGLRARPGAATPLPGIRASEDDIQAAIVVSSIQDARSRAEG